MKGWPDYTKVTGLVDNYDEYAENYPIGIGDGAARLGSIKTYDMRGRAWWLDDFEAVTLHWTTATGGVGGVQGLVSDYVRNGEQALGLTAATGAGRSSSATKYLQLPRTTPLGIEFHFSQEANFTELSMSLTLDDAIQRTVTTLRIEEATGILYYLNAAGGWTDSGINTSLSNQLGQFHTVKVVFDYNTDEHLRMLYDDQELNLNREAMRTLGTMGLRRLYIKFNNEGDGVNNARVVIDDIIITAMEPE